ncbi:sulfite exporter TauE/SafE family protein [Ovoidimarina sediminis]|uniref:sulfite exporter TauE/SafE family protein n=1 Tax=Ovoidimarina sediminis TaxID=3079856 RepID=UPI002912348E|nr:sulfite exporter TauE/SafE family protein [Rhodophyticola sp. MJ-SS7]MDU8945079.1 sulfite exporter TauE/SafE family protein [Rhodophyticola sp. MJ-SS7]
MIAGLETGQFALIAAAAFTAGLVRGFSGFGTAMIYLPIAGQVLSPFAAITTLVLMDIVSPLPNAPRAWREGEPKDLIRLGTGFVIALPLGIWLLTQVPAEVFRYAVSGVALVLLLCLGLGLRYRGNLGRPMIFGTGLLSGITAGTAGLPGPPVILLYMTSARPSQVVRANTLLYLILSDTVILPTLALFGRLDGGAILLGLLMILPCGAGNILGARFFRPGHEGLYRRVAYALIALSAISGLPLWD